MSWSRETRARRDSAGDVVVSLDAFKITRAGITPEHGDAARWQVHSLNPWAQELLIQHANALTPKTSPIWLRGRNERIIGAGFERRKDALSFLEDVAQAAARWS
jgi:hypothetical protein